MNSLSALSSLSVVASATLMTLLSGCGSSNPLIRSVNLRNETIDHQVHLNVDTTLGVNLPDLFPITLPIGQVGTLSVQGKHVILAINATEALRLHNCDATKLPNGTAIPVTPPSGVSLACIPIGGSDSRIYVGFSGQQWLAGFALTVKMNSPVKLPLNVFLPIPMKDPSMQAVGGTFFGPISGLGVFAVKQTESALPPASGGSSILAARKATTASGVFRLSSDAVTNARKAALEKAYQENDQVSVD